MDLTSKSQKELDDSSELKNIKKIEAALFISARWLSLQDLIELTDINPLLLKELLERLVKRYSQDDTSAIEILHKNDMWKMDVREEYHKMINRLATGSAEFSKAEQETLAVIAYKQPVKQSVIIKIRGNKAYEHIKHFIENGLVRSKKLGRTKELSLSEEFFDYFHIEDKKIKQEDLKEIEQDIKDIVEKKEGDKEDEEG